jgi:hypothetical protein
MSFTGVSLPSANTRAPRQSVAARADPPAVARSVGSSILRRARAATPYSDSAKNALQQSKLELPFAVRFWHWPTVAPSIRHTQSRGKAALDWPHLDS